jgi:hypothetical protein
MNFIFTPRLNLFDIVFLNTLLPISVSLLPTLGMALTVFVVFIYASILIVFSSIMEVKYAKDRD